MGVLKDENGVIQSLGADKQNATTEQDKAAGVERWHYASGGIDVLMRPRIDPDQPKLCERVMLTGPSAGSVGGIKVGSSRAEVRRAFGEPDQGGAEDVYLSGGMRIAYENDVVSEVKLLRSNNLLTEGTTAFTRRPKTKLFIEEFKGDPMTGITTPEELTAYLEQMPSIEIVHNKEDADLILRKAETCFEDAKDHYVGKLPLKYNCNVNVDYELVAAADEKSHAGTASAASEADYAQEVELDRELIGLLLAPKRSATTGCFRATRRSSRRRRRRWTGSSSCATTCAGRQTAARSSLRARRMAAWWRTSAAIPTSPSE